MAETLLQLLSRLPADSHSLLIPSGSMSLSALKNEASDIVHHSQLQKGSCIAFCGLSPIELIKAIIAYDGFASAMLLLPASLDESSTNQLIHAAHCTHRIDTLSDDPIVITQLDNVSLKEETSTRWLLASSGTTGLPKLIEHTLASLCRSVKQDSVRCFEFVWGLLYDPSRFAGIQVVLQALLSASRLSVADAMDFDLQVEGFIRNRVNALSATPSLWRKLLMDGRIAKLPLRQITLGGETVDQNILDLLKRSFPAARVVHIYASTEAGAAFSVHDGLAGFPVKWLESTLAPIPLRIRDDGHLLVRLGILPGGKEIVDRIDADGYLDTQDLVRIEGERVYFLGRASGAINVGGNKVNPEEIERYIREVEGVFDIRVYAKKSSIMGQIVAAEIVPAVGVDAEQLRKRIQQHCRTKLANWQLPALISFVRVLKETAAGKRERLPV